MKTWTSDEARARFDEFLDACLRQGPQLVERDGQDAAVLVSVTERPRLTKPTLKELLLCDFARAELKIPPRGRLRRRRPVIFAGKG